MSDERTVAEQVLDLYGVDLGRGGSGLPPARLRPDGSPGCILCDQPQHPDHPRSPYCVRHWKQARLESQRRSRRRSKAAVTPGGAPMDKQVRADLVRAARAIEALEELLRAFVAAPEITPSSLAALRKEVQVRLPSVRRAVALIRQVEGTAESETGP